MFGTNGHMILKCFRKEKRDFRRAVLSGDRSYLSYCVAASNIVNIIFHYCSEASSKIRIKISIGFIPRKEP